MALQDFVNQVYNCIWSEFKEEIKNCDKLCDVKDVLKDNYNNKLFQHYYMLKYFYAYLGEYYCFFLSLINDLIKDNEINVISLGCGCGIDLFSLYYAVKDLNNIIIKGIKKISYTGIDKEDWNSQQFYDILYKCENEREMELVNKPIFLKCGIENYDLDHSPNIIFFPKSLADITEESLCMFCQNITMKRAFLADNFVLAFSSTNFENLIKCEKLILQTFETIGYKYERYNYKPDNSSWFQEVGNGYSFPDYIKDELTKLRENCLSHVDGKCNNRVINSDTCEFTETSPILKTSHIHCCCYKISKNDY